jgi:hypothetical protein
MRRYEGGLKSFCLAGGVFLVVARVLLFWQIHIAPFLSEDDRSAIRDQALNHAASPAASPNYSKRRVQSISQYT